MCGITGILTKRSDLLPFIKEMNETLIHRGPDGGDVHVGNDFSFGHRRLSIVDLSDAGRQPMQYMNRYIITYNGEIYNYIELKDELVKLGYSFSNHTDTEVIMAAYDYWGVECFNKFNGMWAFAMYDSKNEDFLISRDRFGIKPLYYYFDGNVFLFASEIKAILQHPNTIKQANISYLKNYLVNGPREWEKETAFQNIFSFPHASYSIGKKNAFISGNFIAKEFWKLKFNDSVEEFDPAESKKYSAKYKEILKDAVKLRLRSDVKVGSALSGGLDSSSIVSLINQNIHEKGGSNEMQETFSSIYPSEATKDCDESEFIKKIASFLKVKSNTIEPHANEIIQEHRRMIYIMDNPPENTCMSGWYTFKLVDNSDVVVTLDGQGADEQLAGYLGYVYTYLRTCKSPEIKAEKFRNIPGIDIVRLNKAITFNKRFAPFKILYKVFVNKWLGKKNNPFMSLNERLANDVMTNLIQLIHYSDRVSMGFSKESRMPFMDYRLVEFTASVPAAYKLHDGWTKWIAREAMVDILPDEVTFRKDKMGWPIPENYWFKGPLKSWFTETIASSSFLKELGYSTNPKEEIEKGGSVKELVRLLNVAVWHDVFFKTGKVNV